MKAKCKHYKKHNQIGNKSCSRLRCPGVFPLNPYCKSGLIHIDWINYIKYSYQYSLFFNFEDIIYDE